ncbi:hypothetical protein GCM10009792_20620 [Microcella alkalica]|uniref:Uncharacterized protein n=1 Tax=Microcella alkalica TaxID=355930 RepID=A0A839E7Z9_9MICO|nr:hypothetical protein [Microcella alkalica]MBA8847416.1 hypothetical protein [Microcella alkalica]
MIARVVLPLLGLLLLGAGVWLLAEYPIGVSWFGWVQPDDAGELDITTQISAITQTGLAMLVVGGALVGAAIGFALGRRRTRTPA